jgi:hypothetical protein
VNLLLFEETNLPAAIQLPSVRPSPRHPLILQGRKHLRYQVRLFVHLCRLWFILPYSIFHFSADFMIVNTGTPVDCVSLALSGRLFSWSAPALVLCLLAIAPGFPKHLIIVYDFIWLIQVISGISTGSNCGYEMYALVSEVAYLWSVFCFVINLLQNFVGSTPLPLLLQGRP